MSDQTGQPVSEDVIPPLREGIEKAAEADSSQGAFEAHRTASHDVQAACDAVVDAHLGQDRGVILKRLQRELEQRGHWPQPDPWMQAVVDEIGVGHHYRVSAD